MSPKLLYSFMRFHQ